ncbi:MAG: HAD-IC family P-type ATPase [Candidatus Wildermuthbacteria bacterium]|nr:HAD-IC family P-type ATPase [Candidatus Wildermuthbacteria bacterium]
MQEIENALWHAKSLDEVLKEFKTHPNQGLDEKKAKERQKVFGKNLLPEEKYPSPLLIFLRQFRSPLIFILVIAGGITLFLQEYTDSIVIWGAVLLNTMIGYVQENKATRGLSALKKILKKTALVIREGIEKEVPQEDIVPGDILMLTAGNMVAADGRIIEGWDLKINEAVLTGEWIASEKHPQALAPDTPLADRDNMVYMGSTIEEGKGMAVVTATDQRTELGKIATLIQHAKDEKTPYQQRLIRFSWMIGILIGILAMGIFIEGILTRGNMLEMFEMAVAIAVGAIPEGLPVAMTIVLAIGMQRILAHQGLVRHLHSAETLGSASVIATDKTLTLTEGKMEVEQIIPTEQSTREYVLTCAMFANEAFIENPHSPFEQWVIKGRPTDRALLKAAIDAGVYQNNIENRSPRIFVIPFSSEQKYMASFHREGKQIIEAYVAGAPETLLQLSGLDQEERAQLMQGVAELAQKGLRVIALGSKTIELDEWENDPEFSKKLRTHLEHVTLAGFIAFKDPLRKGAKLAIQHARQAGLRTIIVTGDHILTAKAVAQELNLATTAESVIEGKELDNMNDEELQRRLPNISVYARVEPAHKLRIIEAWQNRGEVIAMTGDGINDAPALKKADIGLALGSGTEVAKEVADVILLADNFAIIPAAIREGRVIIDNIRKIITYMLSGSFTETILIGTSILLQTPFLPISALQILWINLIEDGLPGIALTSEKPEKDVMHRPPLAKKEPLLNLEMKIIIFVIGIFTDILLLGLFFFLLKATDLSAQQIQTIIFVGLGLNSLLYIFSCKNLHKNIWQYNPFSNTFLVASVLIGLAALIAAVYLPLFHLLLGTTPLSLINWITLLGLAILNVILIECAKWYFKRKVTYAP